MSGASVCPTLAQVPEDSTVGTLSNSGCTSSTVLTDGGYDYELLGSDTDSRYECPICLLYLRDPVLTTCGHRFCERCISKWVIKEGGKCPVDGVALEYENIFPDNFTRREILQCRAKCPYGKEGCSVVLSLSELEKHIHTIHSPPGSASSSSLKSNNGTGSHSGSLVECYYKEVGCLNFFPQENLQRHLELEMHHHLQLLTAAYRRLKLSRPQDHFLRQDSRDSTRWLLADEAMDADDYQFRRQRSWDSVRFARQTHSRPRFEDRLAESEESLCNKGKGEFHEKGSPLPKDRGAESVNGGSPVHMKELFDRLVRLEQSDREKQIKLDRLESQLSSAVKLFSTVTQAMDDLTARYCNGVYVWKVHGITQRCLNMRKHPSMFQMSPAIYTAVHEYKLCVTLRLNTHHQDHARDGAVGGAPVDFPPLDKDESTTMTTHIHFMKGEFDDVLEWPFNGDIRFDIIHPNPKLTISETVHSRPTSMAFARPRDNTNKQGFGFSNLCTISQLFSQGFIQNDTLILRTCVTRTQAKPVEGGAAQAQQPHSNT